MFEYCWHKFNSSAFKKTFMPNNTTTKNSHRQHNNTEYVGIKCLLCLMKFALTKKCCLNIHIYIYIYIHIFIVSSKLTDRHWGRLEGFLFNTYYSEVSGRTRLLSIDYTTYPWSVLYNAERQLRMHQVPFSESLLWLDLVWFDRVIDEYFNHYANVIYIYI